MEIFMNKPWDEIKKEEELKVVQNRVDKLRNELRVAELELYDLLNKNKEG